MNHDELYLRHILEAAQKVLRFTEGLNKDDFLKNELVQSAVIRQLEIIGEASSKISESFQKSHPELPWMDIIGMRHKLIHNYAGVRLGIVWETLERDLPELEKTILTWFPDWKAQED